MAATTYFGLDVHKKTIAVSLLAQSTGEVVDWTIPHEAASVRRLIRKLKEHAPSACVYEAGPTGYSLQREIEAAGIPCMIAAPSLIPKRFGDKVKTDRRDARKLAEMLAANLLTPVYPPNEDQEALRDLSRCREDAQIDLTRTRHRLSKLLLRRGLALGSGCYWSKQHREWLRSLRFENAADQLSFDDYLLALEQHEARVAALDGHLAEIASEEPYRTSVAHLRCFRGINTVTAICLVAELHDIHRFPSAPSLMAYLGLVPSEHSSGARRMRGRITKTGNRHVRRLLIETSWQYRHRPAVGPRLLKRRAGQPPAVIARADRAQRRLCKHYRRMVERGKHHNTIVVAIARMLVGYIWETMREAQPVSS